MAADPELGSQTLTGDPIVEEATRRFKRCAEWEAQARENFLNDYKFAHGDSDNGFQWPNRIRNNRDVDSRPCLTMNVVRQHNLQIQNEAKQNKSSVAFRATGGAATKAGADMFEAMFRRVEYRSDAQAAYATACDYQVTGGWGWLRVVTEYCDENTFNQDFRIKRVWDPLSIYMDMDCQESNCSDANYGFVFDLVPDDELEEAYPNLAELMTLQPLGGATQDDSWNLKDHTRVCEYFRKVWSKDVLVSFINPETRQRAEVRKSNLPPEVYEDIIKLPLTKWRDVQVPEIQWYLIVGQQVVNKTVWPGKYIPLIRVLGEETVIEGVMDRKGHTRAMKDSQRMYNYHAPLSVDTPLPTPLGWTTMGAVQKGDWLFDEFGKPCQVVGTSPVFNDHKCYRVTFADKSSIIADDIHLWRVDERKKRAAGSIAWSTKNVKTGELLPGKHVIQVAEALELDECVLPVHPYLLGLWLGDGTSDRAEITSSFEDVEETRAHVAALGYDVGVTCICSNQKGAMFTIHGLAAKLQSLSVLNAKFIPNSYMRASQAQRQALLQGLMDSDGCVNNSGTCLFGNGNIELISGFAELIRSLGMKPAFVAHKATDKVFSNGKTYSCKKYYEVSFFANCNMQVFKLGRKRVRQERKKLDYWRKNKRHTIVSVEEVPSVPVKCVTINTPTHLFLAGCGMIPTHNSAQVEFVALQGKTPWIAAAQAIEEYETMWNSANTVNHSVLIYNGIDDEGKEIKPPQRTLPPSASPAYESGMTTAFNQMMMTSGQWQNQMGMGGNERTGAAIDRRQEQSYTAVYHFQDNYASALKFLGKQFLDVVPKIYDTKRLLKLQMDNGEDFDLQLDPGARQSLAVTMDKDQKIISRVLNPKLGEFDVQSDVGPAYGTRREETVRAMTLLLTQNKELTSVIGDLLLSAMNFKEADEAAARLKRMVPKQALGTGPSQAEQALQKQVTTLQSLLAKALQQTGKDSLKLVGKDELRDIEIYEAETKRITALVKQLPLDQPGMEALIHQLVGDSLATHLAPVIEDNEEKDGQESDLSDTTTKDHISGQEQPPLPGARKAPDGEWYTDDPIRPGKFLHVGKRAS